MKSLFPALSGSVAAAILTKNTYFEAIGSRSIPFFFLRIPRWRPGVDVMITFFCDFRQFSAK
jgi:hypothetical protein